jgi:hypothetical protein
LGLGGDLRAALERALRVLVVVELVVVRVVVVLEVVRAEDEMRSGVTYLGRLAVALMWVLWVVRLEAMQMVSML